MKDERCLRFIQNDKVSSFEELLEKDVSASVHHRNIQSLSIKMLQIKHGQSREIVTDIFTQVTHEQNFRKNRDCRIPSVIIVFHGSESTSYQGPKNWEIVPVKTNKFISLDSFTKLFLRSCFCGCHK